MRLAVYDHQPIFIAYPSAQISAAGTAINPITSDNIGRQLPIGAKYHLRDAYFSVSR
jgi:hypothetical protein